MKRNFVFTLMAIACGLTSANLAAQVSVSADWNKTVTISKTTPTLQVVVNPMLRTHSPMHDGTFAALKDMGADFVRYVPWFPYPRLVVPELEPPTKSKTFWDFTEMDSMMADFMKAQEGHSVVINFSTIPAWMFKNDSHVEYPKDPDEVYWNYNQGTELRDTTGKELGSYFARILEWYTKGGFKDELGVYHKSGHYYKIPYWEVLNEPDLEHQTTPEQYTKRYDAIVTAMKKVSPNTKFIGISTAFSSSPEYFEYFLDPAHHKKGIPLEGISYHFYATMADTSQTLHEYQYSFFDQAYGFMDKVRFIEGIRKRLSPKVFTCINEIGVILTGSDHKGEIPMEYWNLAGAMYAYLYLEMAKVGIDVAGESQLVGYPTQFPDVSMMNWKNSKPNARYWVLKLLKDNFSPGDKLVESPGAPGFKASLAVQAFNTTKGKKYLLINKRDKEANVRLPKEAVGASIQSVDASVIEQESAPQTLSDSTVNLKPFAVSIVTLK